MPSHKTLANWYRQLSTQLEAGIPLAEALRISGGPGARDRLAMADQVESGRPVPDVLAAAPKWLPRADRTFLAAALETGHLPQTFARLAERHDRIHANLQKVVLGLVYPLGVFHLAALILPAAGMIDFEHGFQWNPAAQLLGMAALLLPLWALVGLGILLAKLENPLLPRLLRAFPFLRGYSKARSLADLAQALATFLAAGIPAPQAWRAARSLLNDPPIQKAIDRLEPTFQSGADPAPELARHPCFPADFRAFYQSGSRSGQLDEMLTRYADQAQDRANRAMTLAAVFYPGLILAAVAAFLIYHIFKIYGGYLKSFDQFM